MAFITCDRSKIEKTPSTTNFILCTSCEYFSIYSTSYNHLNRNILLHKYLCIDALLTYFKHIYIIFLYDKYKILKIHINLGHIETCILESKYKKYFIGILKKKGFYMLFTVTTIIFLCVCFAHIFYTYLAILSPNAYYFII